jgi:pyruvate kinase (EC 2.7.1.40)
MLKRTKIVATISDQRCEVSFIKSLYDAGMNVARLNTAHMNPSGAKILIDNIRKVSDHIAILVDTKGPEIRTSSKGAEVKVQQGMTVKISGDPNGESGGDNIFVSYPNIHKEVPVGNAVLIDDGEIELRVRSVSHDALVCEVENGGVIKLRKSVNLPGVHINLPSLTQKDKDFVQFAVENRVDFIAHSFVRIARCA